MSSFIELVKCPTCDELKIRNNSHFISECREGLKCGHNVETNKNILELNKELTYKSHKNPIIFIGIMSSFKVLHSRTMLEFLFKTMP